MAEMPNLVVKVRVEEEQEGVEDPVFKAAARIIFLFTVLFSATAAVAFYFMFRAALATGDLSACLAAACGSLLACMATACAVVLIRLASEIKRPPLAAPQPWLDLLNDADDDEPAPAPDAPDVFYVHVQAPAAAWGEHRVETFFRAERLAEPGAFPHFLASCRRHVEAVGFDFDPKRVEIDGKAPVRFAPNVLAWPVSAAGPQSFRYTP